MTEIQHEGTPVVLRDELAAWLHDYEPVDYETVEDAAAHLERFLIRIGAVTTTSEDNNENGKMLGTVGLRSTGNPELLAALDEASSAARESSATPSRGHDSDSRNDG